MDENDELWTKKEVAELLRVSEQTVERLVREGQLPVVRLGRRVLFRPLDVKSLIERLLDGKQAAEGAAA